MLLQTATDLKTFSKNLQPEQYLDIDLCAEEIELAIYEAKLRKRFENDLHGTKIEFITLSADEQKEAMRKGRMKKAGDIATANYFDQIRSDKPVRKFTTDEFKAAILARSKQLLGYDTVIDTDNFSVFNTLSMYFNADPVFETLNPKYSLSKGIMLLGPVGVGKTNLFRLFKDNPLQSYTLLSIEDIADRYEKDGAEILAKYSHVNERSKNYFGHTIYGYMFDDLGAEMETNTMRKNYANSSNVMADIIKKRYNNQLKGNLTHMTSNLNTEQMNTFYGERAFDRMRQMFNFIAFNPTCKSRR